MKLLFILMMFFFVLALIKGYYLISIPYLLVALFIFALILIDKKNGRL